MKAYSNRHNAKAMQLIWPSKIQCTSSQCARSCGHTGSYIIHLLVGSNVCYETIKSSRFHVGNSHNYILSVFLADYFYFAATSNSRRRPNNRSREYSGIQ
eukprot:scaffold1589_cov265-Chaetoceros_neogracile.AAC.1